MPGKVVFAVTNHSDLGNGNKTGYYLPEVAHPWKVLTDDGFEVVYVSPKGGASPMDPGSKDQYKDDPVCKEFMESELKKLDKTSTPDKLKSSDFKALFYPGGHGPMFDLPEAMNVTTLATEIYNNGGVLGAVCHGTVGFVPLKKPSGEPLVKGEAVTCFTDSEEVAVNLVEAMPFLLESKLREQGAKFVGTADFTCNVQVSGRLVSGQNPASATETAKALVKLLK